MRKKKSILAVMLTIMVLFVTATSGVKAQGITDTDAVKNTINKYFTNEFESIKTQKVVDSKDIIMDNEFRNYTNLKNKHMAEWYSKVNENLISYNFVVNYKSIDFNSDECIVTLTRDSEMTFDYAPDISQKTANVEYIVDLKKYDNKWYIEKVVNLAWIQVLTFHDFITTNSPNVGPWAYTVSKSSAQIGDVIQLWKISAGNYNHSIIISSILSDGTILYCGHTTDRLDASLSEVYASGLYDTSKTRFIHIYEYEK